MGRLTRLVTVIMLSLATELAAGLRSVLRPGRPKRLAKTINLPRHMYTIDSPPPRRVKMPLILKLGLAILFGLFITVRATTRALQPKIAAFTIARYALATAAALVVVETLTGLAGALLQSVTVLGV